MALIIADTREGNGANPYLETAVLENNKKNNGLVTSLGGGNISFQIKMITIGDYCILLKDKQSDKTFIGMIIERKTWKDLAASIKDGRSNRQDKNLGVIRQQKGCLVLHIIEGVAAYRDDRDVNGIPFKTLHAKARHNIIRGIPFIQSKDEIHTAQLIVNLARDLMKLYVRGDVKFEAGSDEMLAEKDGLGVVLNHEMIHENKNNLLDEYFRELSNLNGRFREKFIQAKLVTDVVDSIDKYSSEISIVEENFDIPHEIQVQQNHSDSDIVLNMWKSIPGISLKSAALLMNEFHVSDLICCSSKNYGVFKKKIKELKFDSGLKFGEAKASKVIELAYEGTDEFRNDRVREMSVKLISQVPGITEISAKIILEKYSLREICNGLVQEDMISELKTKNGRKIAGKASEKLISLLIKPELTKIAEEFM